MFLLFYSSTHFAIMQTLTNQNNFVSPFQKNMFQTMKRAYYSAALFITNKRKGDGILACCCKQYSDRSLGGFSTSSPFPETIFPVLYSDLFCTSFRQHLPQRYTLPYQLFELKNEEPFKNLRTSATYVLARAWPSTPCMARSNLVRQFL